MNMIRFCFSSHQHAIGRSPSLFGQYCRHRPNGCCRRRRPHCCRCMFAVWLARWWSSAFTHSFALMHATRLFSLSQSPSETRFAWCMLLFNIYWKQQHSKVMMLKLILVHVCVSLALFGYFGRCLGFAFFSVMKLCTTTHKFVSNESIG